MLQTSNDCRRFGYRAGHEIVLSPISLAKIVYLIEKGRLPAFVYAGLKTALADPDFVIQEAPFNAGIVEAMRQGPRPRRLLRPKLEATKGSGHPGRRKSRKAIRKLILIP